MKTKNLLTICICALLTVNLTYARWPSVDPHAENYYPQSPYAFVGGNPVNNIELDGKDWYRNDNGDMMWRRMQDKTYTDDNGVVWTNAGTTYLHQRKDGSAIYFSQGTNDDGELTLSSHGLSRNEMAIFGMFHSEKAKMAAIEDHVNPSAGSFAKMMAAEMAAQWTDPYLLTGGAAIGIVGLTSSGPKTTLHGSQRIAGANATRGGVLTESSINATKSLGRALRQADGAIVYLHETSPGRFNAVVVNPTTGRVITTMGNWSTNSIQRIAKNYGWTSK